MNLMLAVLLVSVVTISPLQAAEKHAATNDAATSTDKNDKGDAELRSLVEQLQKQIAQIGLQIKAKKDADQNQSEQTRSDQEQIMKKMRACENKLADLSSKITRVTEEEFIFRNNMSESYKADCSRFQVELKRCQSLLQDIQRCHDAANKREQDHLKQFAEQRDVLEIIEYKVKQEIDRYANSILQKIQLSDENIKRQVEEYKIGLDITAQQHKRALQEVAHDTVHLIKREFRGDSVKIIQLEEMMKYLMISQSCIIAIPVTYAFCAVVSKLWSMAFKKTTMNEERKTWIHSSRHVLKKIMTGSGAAILYGSVCFLLYRASRCLLLKESLLPYDHLGGFLPIF
jgi:hypothetical protein